MRVYMRGYARKRNVAYVKSRFNKKMKEIGVILTQPQFDAMVRKQKGLCAICRKPPTKRRLSVDHCHKTGRVRGLLCNHCNLGIGYFRDCPKNARSAARYLRRS